MSGGSYEYLCWADEYELGTKSHQIRRMAERLFDLGFDDEAKETMRVLTTLQQAARQAESLRGIWYSVEWADSGDTSLSDVRKAISERRLANCQSNSKHP